MRTIYLGKISGWSGLDKINAILTPKTWLPSVTWKRQYNANEKNDFLLILVIFSPK